MNKHMQTIKDHLWGPTGSVILHVIIVILLINFLVWEVRNEESEVEVEMMEMETVELEEIDKVLEDIEDVEDMQDMEQPMLDDSPPDPTQFQSNEPEMDVSALEVQSDFQGPLVLKGLFAGRSASGRSRMLNQFGGKWGKLTEAAVIKALDWLKRNQIKEGNNSGSWNPGINSKDKYVALAGLGLLAFLAHGETTGSEDYGETVLRAIEFLQRAQGAGGEFCPLNQHGVYAHGIATYAMSEAFALTRIPPLKDSMDRAVEKIVQGQQSSGAWDYHYNKGARRDTSVSSWQIQALKAAYMAGSEVPGISEALDKAAKDLNRNFMEHNSQFRYSTTNDPHNTTPMAVLCLQLIGHGRDDTTRAALRAMKDEECSWDVNNPWAMYRWYYLSQAKFHSGGNDWTSWNNKFAPAYVKSQQQDGHWVPPVPQGGHRDAGYGKAFPTALGALTLQVYYRFLPTYQTQAIEKIEIDLEEIDEEIEVEII
jgi:hypothetical protein